MAAAGFSTALRSARSTEINTIAGAGAKLKFYNILVKLHQRNCMRKEVGRIGSRLE